MKTRNGFVSNSSSSSFVVAFPKKPKGADDVHKFMFGEKDGNVSVYDNEPLSCHDVAHTVFKSLEGIKFKKATRKELVDLFSGQYFYNVHSNTFWEGKVADKDGGAWYCKLGRYCGSDKKLMDQLKKIYIDDHKKEAELHVWERKITDRNGLKHPPNCAYEGGKDKDGNPYTKDQVEIYIKDCDAFYEVLETFRESDAEYIEYRKVQSVWMNASHNKMRILEAKIAKKDVKNFLDDNKGKFVFAVDYSDNDGSWGSTMEHGDIFRNVPHVIISNH